MGENKFGDAILNMLMVLFMKRALGKTLEDVRTMYTFKECSNYVLKIKNRFGVVCDEISGLIERPSDLKEEMAGLSAQYADKGLRIYVRPSGTEDLVRVLIEAFDKEAITQVKTRLDKFILEHKDLN